MRCPLCDSTKLVTSVVRERLPLMQNVVYSTREEAQAAPAAPFELASCGDCGFAFNRLFEPSLMQYDARYNNDVPSTIFEDYYREIARALVARHALSSGVVVDIGAGKGRFLDLFVAQFPAFSGLGIDPSSQPRAGQVTMVADVLRPEHVARDAALVVCRHTLEHVPDPLGFLRMIRGTLAHDVPVFIEVPDLTWTIDNGAFWDFCYEHCNYFTPASLGYALRAAGFIVDDIQSAFGGQYLWAHARPGASDPRAPAVDHLDLSAYAHAEAARIAEARARATDAVLWGMSTKGVLFALLVGAQLRGSVDINRAKIGRFAPLTGLRIDAPEWLTGSPTIFVMNPNYAAEIEAQCRALGLAATFLDP